MIAFIGNNVEGLGLQGSCCQSVQAKWEERSDRWIVEDRKDGSNVNGWHWQEQNRLPWSKQKIDELTKGLAANLDASLGKAEILGVKDLTGEVSGGMVDFIHVSLII